MDRCALLGARLVDPDRTGLQDETLLIEDGRIVDRVSPQVPLAPGWRRVAMPGRFVAPGFIDLHFHGELFDATPARFGAALGRATGSLPACGTTGFLATTMSWPDPALGDRVERLAELVSAEPGRGATCLGLHLEGPWLSPALPGAMDGEAIRAFDPRRDEAVLDRAGDRLRMVTLAPEVDGADALLASLARRGTVASLGHSNADAGAICAGIDRGLVHVTHLFNAMGPFHHRQPGVAGTVLAEDRLTCDVIGDGHHVHPDVFRIAARALGERLVLISDRVDFTDAATGSPASPAAGEPLRLADGTIAGSQLGLDQAVRNAVAFSGMTLGEAVAAVTIRPARLLGVERERGTLWSGARADFAILDEAGRLVETWIGGRPVHTAAGTNG